jgi:hypothetical protein
VSPQALFQFWRNSQASSPLFFYGIIAGILVLLIVAIRILIGRKKKTVNTDEASTRSEEKILDMTSPISAPFQHVANSNPILNLDIVADVSTDEKNGNVGHSTPPGFVEKPSNAGMNTRVQEAITITLTPEQEKELMDLIWETDPTPSPPPPPPTPVEEEPPSHVKFIGYTPINVFAQSEPLHFPYVLMPAAYSVIKFPRKGRQSRKGYKEESFNAYIDQYFRKDFQIFDDRFLPVNGSSQHFEPDLSLLNEKEGTNIFLDIEIDEPYEGINDIARRKAMHHQYADGHRNHWFADRGWIVVRFAEIQVHQDPQACCRFIADVIKSIDPRYMVPSQLTGSARVPPVKQWTKSEAEAWSRERYRERYLGIEHFGFTPDAVPTAMPDEAILDQEIEALVIKPLMIHPLCFGLSRHRLLMLVSSPRQ